MRAFLMGCGVSLLTLILLGGLLEGGTRLLNRLGALPPSSVLEFRLRQPAPYQNATFFSRTFVRESFKQPGGWQTPEGTRLVLPNDFKGTWITTQNHQRSTTGQPMLFRHKVHVLGGSTIYGGEVPDSYTIPSLLQAALNAQTPNFWRVENWGASTVTAAQQLERLKTIPLNRGDVVLFYDGHNDALQGVFYNNPQGWMVQSNREKLASLGPVRAFAVRLNLWLRDRSAFMAAVLPAPDSAAPAHLATPEKIEPLVARTASLYAEALSEAARYSQSKGARFVHVLQPTLASKQPLSAYEQTLLATPMLVPMGTISATAATLPALQKVSQNLKAKGIASYDGTALLNSLPTDVFLDFCHLGSQGNAAVADWLAATLDKALSLR